MSNKIRVLLIILAWPLAMSAADTVPTIDGVVTGDNG